MSSIHTSIIALEFLMTTLSNDTALTGPLGYAPGGVFRVLAPPGTQLPYVIVASHSGADVLSMNAIRIMSDVLFQVRVIGAASQMSQIVSADAEVDNLLGRTSGTANGGLVLACFRESPISLDQEVAGEIFSSLGGLYRLYVQQTS